MENEIENENENDVVDDSDDYDEYVCTLYRSTNHSTKYLLLMNNIFDKFVTDMPNKSL